MSRFAADTTQRSRRLRGGFWASGLLALVVAAWLWAQSPAPAGPPPTRSDNVREILHGVEVVDPYRWLEDQESPETRAWIEAENQYTQSLLGSWPGREPLKQRLIALIRTDRIGTPIVRQGRYFFFKRLANQDLSVLYMRRGLRGKDEVLIDPHPMSADHTTSVSLEDVSDDGHLVAYGVREGGQDEVTVRLLDVDKRKDLADQLPKGRYFDVQLKPDRTGCYYSRLEAAGPRVYYHAFGADPAQDKEIFGQGYGPEKIISLEMSEGGRYLIIHVLYGSAADKTEVYVQDIAQAGPIVAIVNDLNARFFARSGGDQLFLQTNWQAPHGRILAVDLKNPSREHWRTVVPESDAVIDDVALAGGRLFVTYLQDVQSLVKVFTPAGAFVREISFPSPGTVTNINGTWSGPEAFFAFTSFHIPNTIYRHQVASGKQNVWAQLKVPVDSRQFEVKQVWYESKDKTRVPMFLVYKKGLKLDASHPTLLTGYGGFNLSSTPFFSSTAVVWAERGGVYALANLRGGGEFGEEWHRAGMRERKQNVFDDFVAAAEWLIANGYTKPEKLAISGGSNGGLLVGAALTQRPDLFRAVVCSYPLLDMLRYHKFLVARFWVPEYGSADDADQFKYIYAYSPYQHVQPGTKYPAVLFISGDSDTRVAPLHARKMAARLQAATASGRPVLLHYDTKSGHSGGQPVSKQIEDLTDSLSFLFWQLGVPAESAGNPAVAGRVQ